MTKLEKITQNINNNKELLKSIDKNTYYSVENFINDANNYIKAIKQGRMINSIDSVSSSGMSRTIKFLSCEKSKTNFYYRNYFGFFLALGYTPKNDRSNYFRISGCGMDMIFHTNYTIIHRLTRLGFLTKKECSILAQKTPSTI
tara:strand:+ start:265 stop:696 length:432 start_codon:yes stop_codon:yes gene_type:complete